jgi:uncharacterized membrane protein YccC
VKRALAEIVPRWLVEVVRPRPAQPPWPRMVRAPLAICLPLAGGLVTGHTSVCLPIALGGLVSSVVDRGGGRSSGLFLLGAAWGLGLAVLGWVLNPSAPQREAVASVYRSIAQALRVVGTAAAPWVPSVSDSARTPGPIALAKALAGVTDLLAGDTAAEPGLDTSSHSLRTRLSELTRVERYGRLARIYAIRLTLCMGVAAVLSEVLDLQRSYWVMLTTAVVLKPDFGSVFARALQRAIGTMVGVVMAAALLAVVPHGPLLIIPLAVCAFLLPYGMSRNYGLFATFLTPLVALLIDLLAPTAGWSLALARLLDTLLGCAAVLLVGYVPWPSSWHTPACPSSPTRCTASPATCGPRVARPPLSDPQHGGGPTEHYPTSGFCTSARLPNPRRPAGGSTGCAPIRPSPTWNRSWTPPPPLPSQPTAARQPRPRPRSTN